MTLGSEHRCSLFCFAFFGEVRKTEKNDKRIKYLNRSADIICRTAYRLCKKTFMKSGEFIPDVKELKEVCSAVKEAIGIAASLDKGSGGEGIKVVMESAAEKYSK